MSTKTQFPLAFVFVFLLTAGQLHSLTITQDTTQGSPVSAGWNVTTIWNPDGAPVAGNDYINPATFTLRTPDTSGPSFAGDSLTIRGSLGMKSTNNSSFTKTVSNLILDGGSISNFTSGAGFIQTLQGNMNVVSASTIQVGQTSETRHFRFSCAISGSGQVNFNSAGGTGSYLEVTNGANTYSGLWDIASGILRFTSSGSVGSADIHITSGTVEIQHNWAGTGSLLDVDGGNITLGAFNWTVSDLNIGSNILPPDNYTVAELNSYGTGIFSGTGSITVVPEPSVTILCLTGACLVVFRSRRRVAR